jgi:hypothetical protein
VGSLELVAEGWDNTVWLVDGPGRFPFRAGRSRSRHRAGDRRPFFGAAFLPGHEAPDAGLSDAGHSGWGGRSPGSCGRFTALRSTSSSRPISMGEPTWRGAPRRAAWTAQRGGRASRSLESTRVRLAPARGGRPVAAGRADGRRARGSPRPPCPRRPGGSGGRRHRLRGRLPSRSVDRPAAPCGASCRGRGVPRSWASTDTWASPSCSARALLALFLSARSRRTRTRREWRAWSARRSAASRGRLSTKGWPERKHPRAIRGGDVRDNPGGGSAGLRTVLG